MTFKTIITTDRPKAIAACAVLLDEDCDAMFPSGCAKTPEGPATHWISSGIMPDPGAFDLAKAQATVDLYACSDLSDDEPFAALDRLGLVLCELPLV